MARGKFKWQDITLMVGGFIFAPSLIISILDRTIIPIATSLPTAVVLSVFVVVYFNLKLKLAALATSLTAICWFVLLAMNVYGG